MRFLQAKYMFRQWLTKIMLRCRICDCICDPSDLQNGVCDDCRELEQREQVMDRLIRAEFKQLRLEDIYAEY